MRIKQSRASKTPNRVDIEQFSQIINQRRELGHWKVDASWEKGEIENFNGLIRQYLLRQNSLKHISADYLNEIDTENFKRIT